MTTRHDLVRDMEDAETILLALEGLREDIPDKTVIRAIVRCLWHILEYLIRRAKWVHQNKSLKVPAVGLLR